MMIRPDQLRAAILSIVQPMYSGKFKATDKKFSTLIDVPQFDDNFAGFLSATPFGVSVNPGENTIAYYLNMYGDSLAPVIIGHRHLARPLGDQGSNILYSTEKTGSSIKTKISLLPSGDIDMESVDGSIKTKITADGRILLGSDGSGEPLVLGTAFTTLYNAHTHIGNLGVPTGTPIVPMGPSEISAKSFTEI
jgi:hypothetical protein